MKSFLLELEHIPLGRRVISIEEQVEVVTTSAEAYQKVRNTFDNIQIESMAQSVFAHANQEIWEGNKTTHSGDIKAKLEADQYRPEVKL